MIQEAREFLSLITGLISGKPFKSVFFERRFPWSEKLRIYGFFRLRLSRMGAPGVYQRGERCRGSRDQKNHSPLILNAGPGLIPTNVTRERAFSSPAPFVSHVASTRPTLGNDRSPRWRPDSLPPPFLRSKHYGQWSVKEDRWHQTKPMFFPSASDVANPYYLGNVLILIGLYGL